MHAMKASGGSESIAPLIPNVVTRRRRVVSLRPLPLCAEGKNPAPDCIRTEWVTEPVSRPWRKKKILSVQGIEAPFLWRPAIARLAFVELHLVKYMYKHNLDFAWPASAVH